MILLYNIILFNPIPTTIQIVTLILWPPLHLHLNHEKVIPLDILKYSIIICSLRFKASLNFEKFFDIVFSENQHLAR